MVKLNIMYIILFIIVFLTLILYNRFNIEPFSKLIDTTRTQYNKRHRELRHVTSDTSTKILSKIKRIIRKLEF